MTTVLFVNHGLGSRCGVFSYGLRVYDSIKGGKFDVGYTELTSEADYQTAMVLFQPKVVVWNWMQMLFPWAQSWDKMGAKHVVIQHLFDNDSIVPIMNSYHQFDYMMVTDPSLPVQDHRIFAMGRPMYQNTVAPIKLDGPVSIGSFGFAMPHKQFHLIAREINRCFDEATFNLHMTVGDFTGDYSQGILESVEAELTKPGVNLNYTSDYRTDTEIVDAMSRNHMNALFYALPPDNAGLSSAADYMVAAQRPLLVSDCASFKHVHNGTYQWPSVSFDDIASNFNWCQSHSFGLYERLVGRLQSDFEKMIEAIL